MHTKLSTTKFGSNRLRATLSAICIILIASCSQDETAVLPEAQQTAKWVLTATIGNNTPQTKATVKYGQPYEIGEDFTWELNDLINLSLEPTSGGDGTKYGLRFKVTTVSENGNTATLEQYDAEGYTAPTIPPGEYRLYAAYPSDIRLIEGSEHQAYSNYTMSINSSGVAVWQTASNSVQLPDAISQPGAAINLSDNTNTGNPKAWFYMYDYQPTVSIGSGEVNLSLNFKHYTSLLRYTVTNAADAAITLNAIELKFNNAYPFAYVFGLNGDTPSKLAPGLIHDYAQLTSGMSIAAGQTVDFYRPVVPAGANLDNDIYKPVNADGVNLKFTLNDHVIYAPLTQSQFTEAFGADAFKPGYRYAFNVAITGTDPDLAIERMKTYETTDAGVVINGVTWATRNVGAPGTFALRPENAGMYYQWNRKIGWSNTDPLKGSNGSETWDSTVPEGSTWETSNDPCPAGWRIPTKNEIQSLRDAGSVWTTQNGGGRIFGTAPNTIFLPAVGFRTPGDGSFSGVGSNGYIWSNTQSNSSSAYCLGFQSISAYITDYYSRTGFSVRCAKDE
ncbi:MAG: fibrobacter succinogenes major paralogous domain-containing protein [Dysgonamonadaceae bacterium]|jgi:uncharacterized protein (TIGR02145 family)|nr:fibrobacter succinogenes major paralogous domain-containing protein [Dysgonamonadaceae bacterium]